MTVAEILKRVHRKFEGDTDYPESGDEDLHIRIDYLNDAIEEWEGHVREGVLWPELLEDASVSCSGTGSDDMPSDFLTFAPQKDQASVLKIGGSTYTVVDPKTGRRQAQENLEGHIAWVEGDTLRTLPYANGTATFPYIKSATRYETGSETTEPECPNHKFLEKYVLAQLYLADDDLTQYEANSIDAGEILRKMKLPYIVDVPEDDDGWGFGM